MCHPSSSPPAIIQSRSDLPTGPATRVHSKKTGLTLRTPAEWRREQERSERALYEARKDQTHPRDAATTILLTLYLPRHRPDLN